MSSVQSLFVIRSATLYIFQSLICNDPNPGQ
ncbi:LOW QUALITY PROTEIN: hypothetical protein PanWU01x14_360550 [Parasponia andersonii]|uniref:Uncharacterized protein n=1 Tax=Parasponia andersonii TaxID=3476 RepID=A0A2P5A7P2_PARAD|nr:LOW QUALITY PROTEIN: hypothetical protein PanWU01x14_360550 [Parasponia andersonii]